MGISNQTCRQPLLNYPCTVYILTSDVTYFMYLSCSCPGSNISPDLVVGTPTEFSPSCHAPSSLNCSECKGSNRIFVVYYSMCTEKLAGFLSYEIRAPGKLQKLPNTGFPVRVEAHICFEYFSGDVQIAEIQRCHQSLL